MMKSIQRLLLGAGELPDGIRGELAAEDVRFLQEGVTGSVSVQVHRAPGAYRYRGTQGVSAAVAVTSQRLVLCTGRRLQRDMPLVPRTRRLIDVPLTAVPDLLDITLERGGDRLRLAYDVERPDVVAGRVEVRLRTTQATRLAELLAG